MCPTLIPPSSSEAVSDVFRPSEAAADAEHWGNLLQGMRTSSQTAGLGRCMPRQVHAGGLCWPEGVYSVVGGFLSI